MKNKKKNNSAFDDFADYIKNTKENSSQPKNGAYHLERYISNPHGIPINFRRYNSAYDFDYDVNEDYPEPY